MKSRQLRVSISTSVVILLVFVLNGCFSFSSSSAPSNHSLPSSDYPISSDNSLTLAGLHLNAPDSWSFIRSKKSSKHITRVKILDSQKESIENIVQHRRFEGEITVRALQNKISGPRAEEWFLSEVEKFRKEMKDAGIVPETQPVRGTQGGIPFYFTRFAVERDPSQLITDTLFAINGNTFITIELVYGIAENDSLKKQIAESVLAHTRFTNSHVSSRIKGNSFSFSSITGNWVWFSDTRKGMLLRSGESLIARLIPSYSFTQNIQETSSKPITVLVNNSFTTGTFHTLSHAEFPSDMQHIVFKFEVDGSEYIVELFDTRSINSDKSDNAVSPELHKKVMDLLQYDLTF